MLLKLVVASIVGIGLVLPVSLSQKHAAPSAGTAVAKTACCADRCCDCDEDDCPCATCPICSSGACCGTCPAVCAEACAGANKSACQPGQKCHTGMKCCLVDAGTKK